MTTIERSISSIVVVWTVSKDVVGTGKTRGIELNFNRQNTYRPTSSTNNDYYFVLHILHC